MTARPSPSSQGAVALVPEQIQSVPQEAQPVPLTPPATGTLKLLSRLQLVSSVLSGSLVGLALVTYGVSVYVEQQLNQATQRLTQLQRNEQQLTTANEVLKNHMAQQAGSPDAGLIPPTPEHVIFLRPAQQRSQPGAASQGQSPMALPGADRPIGY